MEEFFQSLDLTYTGESGIAVCRTPVYTYPVHSHRYFEFILYEPFEGYITLNGNKITIDSPTVILCTPYDIHSVTVTGKVGECIKVQTDPAHIGECLTSRLKEGCIVKDLRQTSLLYMMFHTILNHRDDSHGAVIWAKAILLELSPAVGNGSPGYNKGIREIVCRAMDIVAKEFTGDISLKYVAEKLHISYQYLSECFSEYTGVSFTQYTETQRMRYAHTLLLQTDMTVTDICYKCGYKNLSHFLRRFKKRYGTSPGQIRIHH